MTAKLKLGKSNKFGGTAGELQNFLFSLLSYLELDNLGALNAADYIVVRASFFTGIALVWWSSASWRPDY